MSARIRIAIVSLSIWAVLTGANAAQEPIAALREPVEKVIAILKDPRYSNADRKDEQRDKIWDIIPHVFDYTEVAKRALARNWKRFTPQERKAFADIFADFLGDIYIDRIEGHYKDLQIQYLGQWKLTDTKAVVKTKVLRTQTETPIDYHMHLTDGRWRIYDVYIEGVSLVKNYRTQFNEILISDTPQELIESLREKVARQRSERAQRDR